MPSIIQGYNYDIFISYRQKDNKYDGWVTEFVDNLKKELEATFKEDLGVYFDLNPHDGLLETHDVDASLKEKLKCLIFIPIISRTYCDSKSFAWQHEFCAFNKLAKEDQFGRDIRLSRGNVASRILPIKINDLDPEDKTLFENELGGVLRGVEFIYKEAGVNRPLSPNDDAKENLNKTNYRNQINKAANAVKEIITALKKHNQKVGEVPKEVVREKLEHLKKLNPKVIIASFCVLALIALGKFFLPKVLKPSGQIENSIAVLPFRNDSRDSTNQYFINGIMDMITTNLQMVKVLRVVSRTSVEQYRNNKTKSISEIARELDVNYIIEGSGQRYGNSFSVTTKLIKAKGKETDLWAKTYEQEITEVNDYIRIESQIAQCIAQELKTTITPEEKLRIEKIPTSNLTAYDFYQRGREEERKYSLYSPSTRHELEGAELMYRTALKYDSSYALSYTGLASVYWKKHFQDEYFSRSFLDSVLILCNIALKYDDQLEEAHSIKGFYFSVKGIKNEAIEEFDKALKVNPNYWVAYVGKGNLYFDDDYIKTIENLQIAASLNHGLELPDLFQQISSAYLDVGFIDKAKYYILESLKLTGDSANYYRYLGTFERDQGNFAKALTFYLKVHRLDSTDVTNLFEGLARCYMLLGRERESLKYHKIWFNRITSLGIIDYGGGDRIGYAYWVNGYKKEAEYYFNEQINYCKRMIELKRSWGQELYAYYDLAGVYAFRDDKDNAYKYLKIFNKRQSIPIWMATLIKVDPLFNSIRNEPEFQQIERDIEAKYLAEHERVRKWLEETGKL